MKRYGGVTRVEKENKELYIKYHKKIPDEIATLISECNIKNYSIFISRDLLFTYYEYIGADYAADMQKMADNANNKKWWELVVPLLKPIDGGTAWLEMECVFHQE